MHQNKKIFLTALMICCVVIMGFSRFGWGESQVYGAAMFANPFAGLALLCMLLGIWLGGNQTMRMVSVFGSFLLVACELYFAATWYIQGVGKFDIGLFFHASGFGFVAALLLAVLCSAINFVWQEQKEKC